MIIADGSLSYSLSTRLISITLQKLKWETVVGTINRPDREGDRDLCAIEIPSPCRDLHKGYGIRSMPTTGNMCKYECK